MSDDMTHKVVLKLIRMTKSGQLRWFAVDDASELIKGSQDVIPEIFVARDDDTGFVLYTRRWKAFDGWNEKEYWEEKIVLGLCKPDGIKPQWEFPTHPAFRDLFEEVRFQVGDVENKLKTFLEGWEQTD